MLDIDYSSLFQNFPPEVATLLIAMLPIAELRAAIPVAIVGFDLPWWSSFIWSVVGNLIPAFFLLLFLEPVSQRLIRNSRHFEKFFNWVFQRTRRRFSTNMEKYGKFIALVLFVAVPLPITGAWTGSVAAFLFGIRFSRSFPAIIVGVLIAGIVVTLTTIGITAFF
ncbi:small multi-drug export protein [Patescibacteria group bacterium]|nr:small multi-drug export protein [Patescibacteria group bacterium]MBU0964020.1 small multi-drug export protein [Patescibacteria group bacterium]